MEQNKKVKRFMGRNTFGNYNIKCNLTFFILGSGRDFYTVYRPFSYFWGANLATIFN